MATIDLGCVKGRYFAVAADDVVFTGLVGVQFVGVSGIRLVAVLPGRFIIRVNSTGVNINYGTPPWQVFRFA